MTTVGDQKIVASPAALASVRLGEELPIFCESCGYSLHGLQQIRCSQCRLLQFHCPECGHHQSINTLRPAAQKLIGRLTAWALVCWVIFAINFFGWLLIAWMGMGYEWSYQIIHGRGLNFETLIAFSIFGLSFGLFGRLLLLRWRHGAIVGGILGVLATAAVTTGMTMWSIDRRQPFVWDLRVPMLLLTFISIGIGAVIAWPIWVAMIRLFLPTKVASRLLQWQQSLSDASSLARE